MSRPEPRGPRFDWLAERADELAGVALPAFLGRQRWFSGKSRSIEGVEVVDATSPVDHPAGLRLLILEVAYSSGPADRFFLPARWLPGGSRVAPDPSVVILATTDGVLIDALADDESCLWLLDLMADGGIAPTRLGRVAGRGFPALSGFLGPGARSVTRGLAEQSNTSIRFGGSMIMKVFRRLEPGENPELEIGRFLTERASFPNTPRTLGALAYDGLVGESLTLGLLQNLVAFESGGWEHALEEAGRFLDAEPSVATVLPPSGNLLELARRASLSGTRAAGGAAAILGRRTAELHLALAGAGDESDFAPEPLDGEALSGLAREIDEQARAVLGLLRERLPSLTPESRELAARVLTHEESLLDQLAPDRLPTGAGQRIRCHGDYHLGQVLWCGDDYIILDFEGEPTKPVALRRAKHSPIKDVVGMLRSYGYAGFATLFDRAGDRPDALERLLPATRSWIASNSDDFLGSYLESMAGSPCLPGDTAALEALIRLYLLDKSFYELNYELGHRPGWTRIPLQAIADLAEAPPG